jgi:hypothetical protein
MRTEEINRGGKIIKRIWINGTDSIEKELTDEEKNKLFEWTASDEFNKENHKHCVEWRMKKTKEVMEKSKNGEATEFEIDMVNNQWSKIRDL